MLYLILQDNWQEEDYGTIARDDSIVHGIFTDKDEAIKIAKTIEVTRFKASFGEDNTNVKIYELPENIILGRFENLNIDPKYLIFEATLDNWKTCEYLNN